MRDISYNNYAPTENDRKTRDFAAFLTDELEVLVRIDFATEEYFFYHVSRYFAELVGLQEGMVYSDHYRIAARAVFSEDREYFASASKPERILEEVKDKGSFVITYRMQTPDGIQWFENKYIRQDEGSEVIVAAVRNINEDIKDKSNRDQLNHILEMHHVLETLSGNYNAVYSADIDTNELKIILINKEDNIVVDRLADRAPSVWDLKQMFIESLVHPEDREIFDKNLNIEYARQKLAYEKQYSIIFRRKYGDEYKYTKLTVAKTEKENMPPRLLMVGFKLVDEQVRTLQKQQEEAIRSMEVINILSKDYALVDYIVLQEYPFDDIAQQFRTSSALAKGIPGWTTTTNFHDRLDLLAEYAVVEADREMFIQKTRRPVILEHLQNDSVYIIRVRIMAEGEEQYY